MVIVNLILCKFINSDEEMEDIEEDLEGEEWEVVENGNEEYDELDDSEGEILDFFSDLLSEIFGFDELILLLNILIFCIKCGDVINICCLLCYWNLYLVL